VSDPSPTVAALIAARGLPQAEARALLAHVLATPREALIAAPARAVDPAAAARFDALAVRRGAGEPLAYLLEQKEFYGRAFRVTPAVLVPRPETELLVDTALALGQGAGAPGSAGAGRPLRVLDLGTGSGCLAITLALELPRAQVIAVDASAAALAVARDNAQRLRAGVSFVRGDWFAVQDGPGLGAYELIVANPPYVAAGDPHLAELQHEPAEALVSGPDGLDALRTIVAGATRHLADGGHLLVEHGYNQGAAVRALFEAAGFRDVRTLRDPAGHERVCLGRAQSGSPGA
jgi:release factor glutamine methyltransferase